MMNRRQALMSTLFGAGYIGLRALATGLPAAVLLNPRRALAMGMPSGCGSAAKAQFIILNTSGNGDPINANVPGMYEDEDRPQLGPDHDAHAAPSYPGYGLLYGRGSVGVATAGCPRPHVRLAFDDEHARAPQAAGRARADGRHPTAARCRRLLAQENAHSALPASTIQQQPLTLGATSPAEGLSYNGAALPIVPALALKATLTNPAGPLTNLQALRSKTLGQLYDIYKTERDARAARTSTRSSSSQAQVRSINQALLDALTSIKDNSADSQVLAAVTLVQMKVTPVISVHIPFGGDNHRDPSLAAESAQTVAGVATIASLMSQLAAAGLSDAVTFATLNVFGRSGLGNTDGRQHNENHQVSVTIGKPFAGGVIGAVGVVDKDYGALAIDSKTGKGAGGDDHGAGSLASYGALLFGHGRRHRPAVGRRRTRRPSTLPRSSAARSRYRRSRRARRRRGGRQCVERQREADDGRAPDDVEPQEAHARRAPDAEDDGLGDERRDEHRRRAHAPHEERHEEDAEDRAVEERAEDVDGLDEVVEQRGAQREDDREDAPGRREQRSRRAGSARRFLGGPPGPLS